MVFFSILGGWKHPSRYQDSIKTLITQITFFWVKSAWKRFSTFFPYFSRCKSIFGNYCHTYGQPITFSLNLKFNSFSLLKIFHLEVMLICKMIKPGASATTVQNVCLLCLEQHYHGPSKIHKSCRKGFPNYNLMTFAQEQLLKILLGG